MSANPENPVKEGIQEPIEPGRMQTDLPAGRQQHAVRQWRLTAWIAGLFTVLVGIGMITAHARLKSSDPWRSPVLLELKEQLRLQPKNEDLKEQIRNLDLGLRERYFRLLSLKGGGVYLLLGGALVFLWSSGQVRQLTRRPPLPQPNPEATAKLVRRATLSRNAVAACSVVALVAFTVMAFTRVPSPLSDEGLINDLLSPEEGSGDAIYAVSVEELRANWPRFRGYQGSAVAGVETLLPAQPLVIWKSATPAKGFNSPIVWKDKVFVTGGDAVSREVFCLDANTGNLKWRASVNVPAPTAAETPEIPDMTGYAPCTAATDGERVYAIFGTGELAAFTLDGQPVWAKNVGPLDNPYGHAASLTTWQDRVIVLLDQGYEDSRESKLLTFDGRTGEIVWQQPRPVGASWTTPIVIEPGDKPQVITLSLPWAIAYAAADGAELWRAGPIDGEVTPSPVFAGGQVFAVNPGTYQLMAIRPDGSGDVSKTHVVWTADGDMPDITSPVSNGELVFTINSGGSLTCMDAKSGDQLWVHDLRAEFQASPSIAGNAVCLLSAEGELIAVEAGREFRELWRMKLEDQFHASPAFANGKVYLKGAAHVWCLGAEEVMATTDNNHE